MGYNWAGLGAAIGGGLGKGISEGLETGYTNPKKAEMLAPMMTPKIKVGEGEIAVRDLATGLVGSIPEKEFDPEKYEKLSSPYDPSALEANRVQILKSLIAPKMDPFEALFQRAFSGGGQ